MDKSKLILTLILVLTLGIISCDQENATGLKLLTGSGDPGFADGLDAKMNKPIRLTPFTDTSVLVADIYNHAIREVSINGQVKTLVGGPDKKGHQDGDAEEAKVNAPHGVAYDAQNQIIYFAEASNHVIRAMHKNDQGRYVVSTLAGTPEIEGFQDGVADSARFSSPHAILIGPDGGIVVADIGNARIRKIKQGSVTTLAGSGESGSQDGKGSEATFQYVMDMAYYGKDIYAADAGSHLIRIIDPDNQVSTFELKDTLNTPHGIAVDENGQIYIADMGSHRILGIDRSGDISVLAGTGHKGKQLHEFNKPAAVLVHQNLLWIADLDNHQIKTLTL